MPELHQMTHTSDALCILYMCILPDEKSEGYDGHDIEEEEYEEQNYITPRPHISKLEKQPEKTCTDTHD